MKNLIELIQVFIAMIIMVVMIGLTLVSAETATINPSSTTSYNAQTIEKVIT